MLIDAMKSAGPKMIVSTRGDLDADPPDLVAHRLLDLGEQQVEGHDLLGRLHLREHDRVEVGARPLDDFRDVAVGPLRGPVVHPDHADLLAPAALVERLDDRLARPGLGQRRAGVLEVEEDLVGVEGPGLVDELLARTRHGEAGPAGADLGRGHGTAPR
jgi:hypothetical protein